MEERRVRRFGRARAQSFLPLGTRPRQRLIYTSFSFWYCDLRIYSLNEPLFRFGRKHATCLRLWFSIGIGFGLTALLAATLVLLGLLFGGDYSSDLLFGFPPSVSRLSMSLSDAGYLLLSTLLSVAIHECGHAFAAASEGIRLEYIAVFIALLFPGALVAFDHDLLQALPRFTALRIYCAGIWHNAVFCAVCGLLLFLMPLILFPFYIHSESPLVLDVAHASPLSGILLPGDVIVSLNGVRTHDEKDWMEMTALVYENSSHSHFLKSSRTDDGRKGYCVPNSLLEEGKKVQLVNNQSACPNDLIAFVNISCSGSSNLKDMDDENSLQSRREGKHCLNARDVVKLDKCGDGWGMATTNKSSFNCSQGKSCLSPVQLPGLIWIEITYSRSESSKCMEVSRSSFPDFNNSDIIEQNCGGTFVFVGDVISMVHSVQLTAYQPRWDFAFGAYFPNNLERSLICMFHVSLTLALLNSLPVYFLDGESILEVTLCHFTSLSPGKRRKVLQICLTGGTFISIFAFLRILFFNFF